MPASLDRAASCWDTADGVRCTATAVAAMVPQRSSSRRISNLRTSIMQIDLTHSRKKKQMDAGYFWDHSWFMTAILILLVLLSSSPSPARFSGPTPARRGVDRQRTRPATLVRRRYTCGSLTVAVAHPHVDPTCTSIYQLAVRLLRYVRVGVPAQARCGIIFPTSSVAGRGRGATQAVEINRWSTAPLPGHGYTAWFAVGLGAIGVAWGLLALGQSANEDKSPLAGSPWAPLKLLVDPSVQYAVLVGAAIVAGFGFRGIRVRHLIRGPGPIEIDAVKDATDSANAPVAELTSTSGRPWPTFTSTLRRRSLETRRRKSFSNWSPTPASRRTGSRR